MRRGVLLSMAIVSLVTMSAGWARAQDGGWLWPVESRRILLGYGERYGETIHRGLDVAEDDGARIVACDGGEVVFRGKVPGAAAGSRALAVTVARGDLKVTYMPLEEAVVRAGEVVEAGTTIGTLAGEGDVSSSEPHLHLSVRRNGAYVDPQGFLAPEPAAAAPVADPAPEPPAEPLPEPEAPAARPETTPRPAAEAPVSEAGRHAATTHPSARPAVSTPPQAVPVRTPGRASAPEAGNAATPVSTAVDALSAGAAPAMEKAARTASWSARWAGIAARVKGVRAAGMRAAAALVALASLFTALRSVSFAPPLALSEVRVTPRG